jgi:hypothetical protein
MQEHSLRDMQMFDRSLKKRCDDKGDGKVQGGQIE